MKPQTTKKIAIAICVLLVVALLAGLILSVVPTAQAASLTSLRDKAKNLEAEKKRLKEEISSVRSDKNAAIRHKNALDASIANLEEEINNTQTIIVELDNAIVVKETELTGAERGERDAYEKFRKRVRAMEEAGDTQYLGIILQADSFQDLLVRADAIGEIAEFDRRVMADLKTAREEIERARAALETDKLEQASYITGLEQSMVELEDSKKEAESMIAELVAQEKAFEKAYDEADEDMKRVSDDINAKIKEQQTKAPTQWVGGTYTWPTPGYNNVTSPFGTRFHPVLKVNKFHSGIDIGAPGGASIVASNKGTVITSGYSSGYGNYVVIDHGGGQATLYGHMSKRLVSEGQSVAKGEKIGLVGTTGLSTGNHLHFEIIVNGEKTDPMKQFSKG